MPCAGRQKQPAIGHVPPRRALGLNLEADLFRQRSLPRIERDKLLGPEDEGGGDVDDVERATAER